MIKRVKMKVFEAIFSKSQPVLHEIGAESYNLVHILLKVKHFREIFFNIHAFN